MVVGGGIAGLAAAHRLVEHAQAGAPLDVILLEASDQLGGSVGSVRTGGCASGSASPIASSARVRASGAPRWCTTDASIRFRRGFS